MRSYSPTAAVLNLLLGVPAVVPVWLLWYFAVNWPLSALGWTSREPTENDGVLPMLVVLVPVVGVFTVLWWLANRAVRRRTAPGPARVYWPLSVLLLLVPTSVLIVAL
ncbi:hypothetical protein [Kitasatospora sp. NBC_01302]|uniref:hypothetical protein n=1 Tax=Kitasatospora sp. NBC_01302 TaxID=2903575 RepID=UPI002E0E2FE8|nr:hypothetical protein OG294_11840 [Kitasatospora sp. NBC_01302]